MNKSITEYLFSDVYRKILQNKFWQWEKKLNKVLDLKGSNTKRAADILQTIDRLINREVDYLNQDETYL